MEVTEEGLARFFDVVLPHMNEVQRRVVAGAAAEMLGRGGKTAVANASGMSRNTVIKAEGEVIAGIEPSVRLRAPGGGDKSLLDTQPGLLEALDELVYPETRGNPMSKLRWTSKSSTKLADELVRQGFEVSSRSVLRLLHKLGYSLQANAKVSEGRQHPDRDAQFNHLGDTADAFIEDGQPVISVDSKKKELIGNYANGGAEWAPAGFAGGRDVSALSAHIDVFPTLAEITGSKIPETAHIQVEGRSLLEFLKNPEAKSAHRFLVTHCGRWPLGKVETAKHKEYSIRDSRFTLVNNEELYDLQSDPGETTNVIAQHPEEVARLRAYYDTWWADVLPRLENEHAVAPSINPFKERYWKQFGGGPDAATLRRMKPGSIVQ